MRRNWPAFDGWCASLSLDPLRLPIERRLNLAYYWFTRDADRSEVDKFDRRLWTPPPSAASQPIPEESPWSASSEMKAFSSFAAEATGRKAPGAAPAKLSQGQAMTS